MANGTGDTLAYQTERAHKAPVFVQKLMKEGDCFKEPFHIHCRLRAAINDRPVRWATAICGLSHVKEPVADFDASFGQTTVIILAERVSRVAQIRSD